MNYTFLLPVYNRRFFNTDRPSDFVPMAFVIYTCVLSSIDEERLVEAENKKKKKRKRRKEIEERKVKLCRGSVIERFCFCSRSFFSLFRSMLFTVSTIEPVGNWSGRIEENFHDPLQLDDVPLFSFFFQEYVYSNCIVFFKKRFDFSSKQCLTIYLKLRKLELIYFLRCLFFNFEEFEEFN